MDEAVMVSRHDGSFSENEETYSMDSTFDVVSPGSKKRFNVEGNPPPSLNTASLSDGDRYEQRADIIENKKLKERMKQKLQFYEKEKIDEVRKRIDARENLDQEIDHEIKNIEELTKNKEGVNEILLSAAQIAAENMKETQKVAKDGKTTVRRAMEIIKSAFPVFLSAWGKSQEKLQTNEEITEELEKFELARLAVAEAGLDIDKRVEKTDEFKAHIAKAIELGEKDVQEIMDKREKEESEKRPEQCATSKEEIEVIVQTEIEEVDAWLVTCKNDKDELSKFQEEQINRNEDARAQYEKRQNKMEEDIKLNKKQQEDLIEKLKKLRAEEERIDKERIFQQEVQKRAEKLNKEIIMDITNRQDSLGAIESRADTARKVVELMTTCGNTLINSSMEAEKEYLDGLLNLEKHSKESLRNALAHSAVETRIKNEHSTQNMEDCKENMKVLKDKWEKAAKTQNKLVAAKSKESYEEYKGEFKREKGIMVKTEKEFKVLMEKLEKLEEDLNMLKVPFSSFVDMYELRMQEIQDANSLQSGFSDMSADSDMSDNEEEFNDALA